MAYFGVLKPFFEQHYLGKEKCEELSADTALAIQDILNRYWKVHFWDDEDAQKQVINEIDDYLFDEIKGNKGTKMSLEQMDEFIKGHAGGQVQKCVE